METLLNRAVRQKFPDVKVIEIGLNTGASPNDRDENLQNPLHFLPTRREPAYSRWLF